MLDESCGQQDDMPESTIWSIRGGRRGFAVSSIPAKRTLLPSESVRLSSGRNCATRCAGAEGPRVRRWAGVRLVQRQSAQTPPLWAHCRVLRLRLRRLVRLSPHDHQRPGRASPPIGQREHYDHPGQASSSVDARQLAFVLIGAPTQRHLRQTGGQSQPVPRREYRPGRSVRPDFCPRWRWWLPASLRREPECRRRRAGRAATGERAECMPVCGGEECGDDGCVGPCKGAGGLLCVASVCQQLCNDSQINCSGPSPDGCSKDGQMTGGDCTADLRTAGPKDGVSRCLYKRA